MWNVVAPKRKVCKEGGKTHANASQTGSTDGCAQWPGSKEAACEASELEQRELAAAACAALSPKDWLAQQRARRAARHSLCDVTS